MIKINSSIELQSKLDNNNIVLAYFSHENCNVCKVLKPKLSKEFLNLFPEMIQIAIDTIITPEISASYQVFTAPVVIIFFEGKEFIRKARSFGIKELANEIKRPYQILLQ